MSAALRLLHILIWILELQEPEQVQILGWVMEPSLRYRFSICTLLVCAQVVALFCQEDRDTGESQMFQLMCEEADGGTEQTLCSHLHQLVFARPRDQEHDQQVRERCLRLSAFDGVCKCEEEEQPWLSQPSRLA